MLGHLLTVLLFFSFLRKWHQNLQSSNCYDRHCQLILIVIMCQLIVIMLELNLIVTVIKKQHRSDGATARAGSDKDTESDLKFKEDMIVKIFFIRTSKCHC